SPRLREIAAGERRSLPAIVPAPKRRDQNGVTKRRLARDSKLLGHDFILRLAPGSRADDERALRARPLQPKPLPRRARARARVPKEGVCGTAARRAPSARATGRRRRRQRE